MKFIYIFILLVSSCKTELNNSDTYIALLEEEKMAFQLYDYFYSLYGSKPFYNIKQSEETHFDTIESLLDKYQVNHTNIALNDTLFTNPKIKDLFYKLKQQGEISEYEAYKVGKFIEETDINDLQEAQKKADKNTKDILQYLIDASYRHLNAFNKHL